MHLVLSCQTVSSVTTYSSGRIKPDSINLADHMQQVPLILISQTLVKNLLRHERSRSALFSAPWTVTLMNVFGNTMEDLYKVWGTLGTMMVKGISSSALEFHSWVSLWWASCLAYLLAEIFSCSLWLFIQGQIPHLSCTVTKAQTQAGFSYL